MHMGPIFAQEIVPPFSALDAVAIRKQLERLLAHPLFCNSKRYPVLLAHIVQKTLKGNAAELKERSIGIEVFGRQPTYDTNADPVVRITASEVRKRLMQYYYDASHDGEIVIELPLGTYAPLFHAAESPAVTPLVVPELPEQITADVTTAASPRRLQRFAWLPTMVLVILAVAVGIGIGSQYHYPKLRSSIDRFWTLITADPDTVTYCLGEPSWNFDVNSIDTLETPTRSTKSEPLAFSLHYSGLFALADVITLAHTAAELNTNHKALRVLPASDASFALLREGPIVLIGAFDNIWTLRITQKLRFGFECKNDVFQIVDRKSSVRTTWTTVWDLPHKKLSRDYAIVARIHDSITGQPVVIAAGISEEGTEAAGEILDNPVYLQSLLAKAPKTGNR